MTIHTTTEPQWSPVMKTGNTGANLTGADLHGAPQWSPVMKTGNTIHPVARLAGTGVPPQWSPVMKTGNTTCPAAWQIGVRRPQWSPVMKTGNTTVTLGGNLTADPPQWSPVMKTGNTRELTSNGRYHWAASMEPGHEDREYVHMYPGHCIYAWLPQWSPVMKTGNTAPKCTAST